MGCVVGSYLRFFLNSRGSTRAEDFAPLAGFFSSVFGASVLVASSAFFSAPF
jgi:fluoride ion exporter CrcB/FEX